MAHDHRVGATHPTGPHRRLRRRHRGRRQALLPPDAAGREPDRLQEPDPAVEPGVHGGLLLQAPHRLGAAREVLRRASSPPPAASAGTCCSRCSTATTRGRWPRRAGCRTSSGATTCSSSCRTTGWPAQRETNPKLVEIAKQIGAPLLATNDSHYTHQHDHESHEALLCVQTGALLSDPKRFKFEGTEHYLKTAAEMRYLFREVPTACDNSLWIAERAELEIEFGKPLLPNFPLPAGFDDDAAYLTHLTWAGAKERWGDDLSPDVAERLAYELKVICDMGFASYFLITWDLIKYAKDRGIRVGPGRGSAAGCAVAYSLRITDLDPVRYDLLFERFLNPSRISMPDIDMDFDSRYRDEMIRYAAERYGRDHVAQIITFGTIKARNAVRDAARVLGYPYGVGDKLAKAMPPMVMGRDTPLKYCFEESPKYADGYKAAADLRAMYDSDRRSEAGHRRRPRPRRAEALRRHPRRGRGDHQGAGHRLRPDPAQARVGPGPRRRAGRHAVRNARDRRPRAAEDGLPRAAQPRRDHRHGGDDQGDCVTRTSSSRRSRSTIPPRSRCCHAATRWGCSSWSRRRCASCCKALAPTSFEDVAALIALYRPGPMGVNMHYDYADRKNNRKPVEYFHPDAEEVLGDTYGLMIYQESVMRVAQKFAGYNLAEADNLRKACGKKIREMMAKERDAFEAGVVKTGLRRAARQAAVRHHREVRRLRVRQEPFVRLRPRHVSDGVPEGALPGRVPGLSAHERQEQPRQGGDLPRRLPIDGHQGAAARRQPVGQQLRRAVGRPRCPTTSRCRRQSRRDHVRAVGGAQRGRGPRRAAGCRTRRERRVLQLPRLRRAGSRAGAQQAHRRVADQGRCVRLARPSAPRPADGVRAHHRLDGEPSPRAREGRDEPVRRLGRRQRDDATTPVGGRRILRAHRDPRARLRQDRSVALREGDARALRVRPSAVRRRGVAATQGRAPTASTCR